MRIIMHIPRASNKRMQPNAGKAGAADAGRYDSLEIILDE